VGFKEGEDRESGFNRKGENMSNHKALTRGFLGAMMLFAMLLLLNLLLFLQFGEVTSRLGIAWEFGASLLGGVAIGIGEIEW